MIKNTLRLVIGFSLILLLSACSGKQAVQKQIIVIPSPPEEPRLFYIKTYQGEGDFVKSNTLDYLIGEEADYGKKNFMKPYGAMMLNNKLYVADTIKGVVFVVDEKAKKVTLLGASGAGKLAVPVTIAHDKNNNIYVSDAKSRKIYGYNSQGKLFFALGTKGEFKRPAGIAINQKLNRLYVVDTQAHKVKVYSLNGKYLFSFGKRGTKDGEFNFPTNIAIDKRNDNVVIVDTQNFRVQTFDADGKFISKFGKIGDRPGMFARPKGIAIDSEGHYYIADTAFSNIQVFDDKGTLLLFFGDHGYGPTKYQLIAGLYMDENDVLYAVDSYSGKVDAYQYVSKKWKEQNPEKYQELKNPKITKSASYNGVQPQDNSNSF